ncbi:MAG: serine/threonine protein kinase [Planctomycetes bacterium]|nr:serine/threonine protein kinase [Planctomycetota bacterium]
MDECLSLMARLVQEGVTPPRLGELLVRRGYLAADQVEATLRQSPPSTARRDVTRTRAAETPADVVAADADPANRLGKYVRVSRLGAGGMGEVWRGWDRELGRWVALKFLKHDLPEELARFQREARTAARLSHPHIASVYEVGDLNGKPYIAMQFVAGQTFAKFPRERARAVVELVRDAATAVHYAHEKGVVHRDLKPANLMVEPPSGEGRPREADDGRVVAVGRGSDSRDAGLHVAGAGARRHRGRGGTQRPLFAGGHPLRDARRPAALPREGRLRAAQEGRGGGGAAAQESQAADRPGPRDDRDEVPREGSRAASCERPGTRGGADALAGRRGDPRASALVGLSALEVRDAAEGRPGRGGRGACGRDADRGGPDPEAARPARARCGRMRWSSRSGRGSPSGSRRRSGRSWRRLSRRWAATSRGIRTILRASTSGHASVGTWATWRAPRRTSGKR